MNHPDLLKILLIAALLATAGCGESPQQGGSDNKQSTAAPASGAPSQNAMAVAPAENGAAPPTTAAPQLPGSGSAATASPAPATVASTKTATAQSKGELLKQSELKEKPFIDAATLATLAAQTPVAILERNGGWYRVSASGREGWIRMLNVKVTQGAETLGSGSDLTQAASLATGRVGSGNVVSTSGLRGLSEETLSEAQPDYAQFDKLSSYGVDQSTATAHAKSSGLKSRPLAYLPAPAK